MIARFLFWLSGFLPGRLINIEGNPYLERYYLFTFRGRVYYLHRFLSGDGDRNLHNHPWSHSVSIILSGGYTESRVTNIDWDEGLYDQDIFRLRFLSVNRIPANVFHRIMWVKKNTWTLFSHDKQRTSEWGFLRTNQDTGKLYVDIPNYHDKNVGWWKTAAKGWRIGREPFVK